MSEIDEKTIQVSVSLGRTATIAAWIVIMVMAFLAGMRYEKHLEYKRTHPCGLIYLPLEKP